MPTIKYKNEVLNYHNHETLSRRLGISFNAALKLIMNPDAEKIIFNNGNVQKNTLSNPVFMKEFGIKRMSNKKFLSPQSKIKGIEIFDELPGNKRVDVRITVDSLIDISKNVDVKRTDNATFLNVLVSDIKSKANEIIEKAISKITEANNIRIQNIVVSPINNPSLKLQLVNGKLRKENIKLPHLFNELIEVKENGNCVRQTLLLTHKKISKKVIMALGDKSGVTVEELKEFCEKYRIRMIAYDINGTVIGSHYPMVPNKSYRSVIGIAYNNHWYPLKNKILNKKGKYTKVKITNNAMAKLRNFIEVRNILPENIVLNEYRADTITILSFVYNDVKYLENPEYRVCENILTEYGLLDKIHDRISLNSIGSLIEKLYLKSGVNSFIPNHGRFVKGGYTHCKDVSESEYSNVSTIDKSKCYSSCLQKLPFLIHCDFRQSKIFKYPKTIVDEYLYVVEPKYSTLLMPDVNMYSGRHVKFCEENGIKFKVIEGMVCQKSDNFYSEMVTDLYEKFPDEAKNIMNVHIGKFESDDPYEETYTLDKICNTDEASRTSGIRVKINDGFTAILQKDYRFSIFTKKPISVQIKDASRRLIYEKIKELNIPESNVVQIKTDSFSWIDSDRLIDTFDFEYDDLNKWKKEEFKKIKHSKEYFKKVLTMRDNPKDNYNKIYNAQAGAGKSYHIMNTIVPNLDDYIILTPSHSSVKEYREKKYTCNTIQYYVANRIIPTQKNIIFDEHGLFDKRSHDFVYKCFLASKTLQSFGDWDQLLPVKDTHYNAPHYLKMVFRTSIDMDDNHRNNFTKEYYNSLIDGPSKYGLSEVKRHSCDSFEEADVILCYRKEIRAIYNEKKLHSLGYKSMFDIGVKLMCETNRLAEFNIHNSYILYVTKNEGNNIELSNGAVLSKHRVSKNFRLGYALNVYNVQGKSIDSYYWCEEDDCFVDSRMAYTTVSRLRQKRVEQCSMN